MSAPADFLASFAARFRPDAAGDLRAVYQLHLTGDDGGLWHLTIADQQCRLASGQADQPSVTITMSVDDFSQLISGRLDGVSAYLAGRIQIAGDISLVTRLQSLFDF
jgi:putative sterol carrier protein